MKIEPMLAETCDNPEVNWRDYLVEEKLDGCRAIAYLNSGTTLQGRSLNIITHKFPELQKLHLLVNKPCILDGEIVSFSFTALQERIHLEDPFKIRIASRRFPVIYYVFDILYLEGKSLLKTPLEGRKYFLSETVKEDSEFRVLPYHLNGGIELFEEARRQGKEGIMIKKLNSLYYPGKRSKEWLKLKAFKEDEFLIVGATVGEGERASTFGSLILAQNINGELVYFGEVGSGFTQDMLLSIDKILSKIKSECPFKVKPKIEKEVKLWVEPILTCEVRYFEKAENGLRFPSFRGLKGGQWK